MDDDVTVQWEVHPDQIDLDRWAKAIYTAMGAGEHGRRTAADGRWWAWVALAVVAFALIGLVSSWTVVAMGALPMLVLLGVVVVLKVTGERRLAKQLKRIPATAMGFSFTADASGTKRSGAGGSDQLPWSRYRAARLDVDVIALLLDNNTVVVLPNPSLEGAKAPADVVGLLETWIAAAHPVDR